MSMRATFTYLLSFILIGLSFSCKKEDAEEVVKSQGSYVNVPDATFELNLIAQGIDSDLSVNQKLLRSDAEQVKRLSLQTPPNYDDISSLEGIEAFKNLRYLNASGQKIEKIDLSHNVLLDSLLLQSNDISQIDLSQNKNLRFVDLMSNQLKFVMGLEKISLLKELYVSFNELDSFSISNSSLELLNASHNNIQSLNIRQATALKALYMPINLLTDIDLSQNVFLENLVLSANQLQHIDISRNQALEYFYISSNLLQELDVSANASLIDLRVDRNPNLNCIQIDSTQQIPNFKTSSHQSASVDCN